MMFHVPTCSSDCVEEQLQVILAELVGQDVILRL